MKLCDLVYATDYDVYLHSQWSADSPKPETNRYLSDILMGCSAIRDLTVFKIIIAPEDLAIYALVDLPEEILTAIYNYNTFER